MSSVKGTKSAPKTEVKESKTKETKQTEPKTAVNQQTADAGLTLSVTAFRTWMKNFVSDGDKSSSLKFSGGQIVLTSFNEILCKYIIEQALSDVGKDSAGLYTLTRPVLRNTVLLNNELAVFFQGRFDKYDQEMKYGSQYCINQKIMTSFINENCGKNINYDDNTYHMIIFLLLKASSVITTTAFKMMQYAKRKTLDENAVITAIDIYFTGELGHRLHIKAEEAVNNAKKNGTLDENENVDDNASTSSTNKKKVEKVSKGKSKVEEEEEDEDEVEEEEEEEEEEVVEEEEEPEPPKPQPKKSGNKGKSK